MSGRWAGRQVGTGWLLGAGVIIDQPPPATGGCGMGGGGEVQLPRPDS